MGISSTRCVLVCRASPAVCPNWLGGQQLHLARRRSTRGGRWAPRAGWSRWTSIQASIARRGAATTPGQRAVCFSVQIVFDDGLKGPNRCLGGFPLGSGCASGEAQRNPPLRSSAEAQRLALGCRRPAFLACCPRLAGAARGGPWRLQCCPGAPSCARGTLHRHPCLSAHTAPPTHVAFAHLWCAPLTQRRALRLPPPGSVQTIAARVRARPSKHLASCGAAIGATLLPLLCILLHLERAHRLELDREEGRHHPDHRTPPRSSSASPWSGRTSPPWTAGGPAARACSGHLSKVQVLVDVSSGKIARAAV